MARKIKNIFPQVHSREVNNAFGWFHEVENVCSVRRTNRKGRWRESINANEWEADCPRLAQAGVIPKGMANIIPAKPTRRSAAMDARQMARSKPICITPARRTTSPPIVVGRKCEAKSPINVSSALREKGIFTPPDRSSTCQRAITNTREISREARAKKKLIGEICLRESTISVHPS